MPSIIVSFNGLKRKPSDYVKDNIWFTTQPLDLPGNKIERTKSLEWWKPTSPLLYSSDYPHWTFDDPRFVVKHLPEHMREQIMFQSSIDLFKRLPATVPALAWTDGVFCMSERETPSDRRCRGREHIVATVDEIAPGKPKVVPIGRYGVGVYNVKGKFYATELLPSRGRPLCGGRTHGQSVVDEESPGGAAEAREGEFIYCPWHQWGFELATGTTAVKPEWSIRTYPVRVQGNDVIVTA